MLISGFLNLAGPDFIIMAIIIVVLAAPAIIAIPIIFYLNRHRGRPGPLPPSAGLQCP
jgi:uncharacterized RDD family membrane protein YckC